MNIRTITKDNLNSEEVKEFLTENCKQDEQLCLTIENANQLSEADLIDLYFFIFSKKWVCKLEFRNMDAEKKDFNQKFAKLYQRRLIEYRLNEILTNDKENQSPHSKTLDERKSA